jgi:hypothetical protein
MVEVNVAAYGNALKTATNTTPSGLYDTNANDKLGGGKGLRQYYRWGLYSECKLDVGWKKKRGRSNYLVLQRRCFDS